MLSWSIFPSLSSTVNGPVHLFSGFPQYTSTSAPTSISFIAAKSTFALVDVFILCLAMVADTSLRAECMASILEIWSGSCIDTTGIFGMTPSIKRVGTSPWGLAVSFIGLIAGISVLWERRLVLPVGPFDIFGLETSGISHRRHLRCGFGHLKICA